MSTTTASIDVVNQPIDIVYNQWTQFEEFPKFMEGVEQVRQLDDRHLHWVAEIAGKREEWDAEILEQVPDQRIAWRSTSGARNAGVVSFQPVGRNRTPRRERRRPIPADPAAYSPHPKIGAVARGEATACCAQRRGSDRPAAEG